MEAELGVRRNLEAHHARLPPPDAILRINMNKYFASRDTWRVVSSSLKCCRVESGRSLVVDLHPLRDPANDCGRQHRTPHTKPMWEEHSSVASRVLGQAREVVTPRRSADVHQERAAQQRESDAHIGDYCRPGLRYRRLHLGAALLRRPPIGERRAFRQPQGARTKGRDASMPTAARLEDLRRKLDGRRRSP